MATYQNDPDSVNQMGMVDDPNQGVIGQSPTMGGQTQQSAPMAPQTSQSALVRGGAGTSARKPTSSGQNFTDIGAYLDANRAGVEKARGQIVEGFREKGQQQRQDIQSGIQGIVSGQDVGYRPTSDIAEAQAEYQRSMNPNYIYDQYGQGNISQRNTGMNRLDRSIMGRAGTGAEARQAYEQEIQDLGDYAKSQAQESYNPLYQSTMDSARQAARADVESRRNAAAQSRYDELESQRQERIQQELRDIGSIFQEGEGYQEFLSRGFDPNRAYTVNKNLRDFGDEYLDVASFDDANQAQLEALADIAGVQYNPQSASQRDISQLWDVGSNLDRDYISELANQYAIDMANEANFQDDIPPPPGADTQPDVNTDPIEDVIQDIFGDTALYNLLT